MLKCFVRLPNEHVNASNAQNITCTLFDFGHFRRRHLKKTLPYVLYVKDTYLKRHLLCDRGCGKKKTFRNEFDHWINMGLSACTGKLCIFGHLGLVFIWSCFVSCLLLLLYYVICAPVLTEGTININHSTVMRICSFVIFAEELGAINELTPKFNF